MKKATTLMELVVVISLFALLYALLFEILALGRRAWDVGSGQQEIEGQARQGMENMLRELYESSSSRMTPTPPFSDILNLTFQLPIGYNNTTAILLWGSRDPVSTGYCIRFRINDQQQLVREILDTADQVTETKVLANYAQNLTFSASNRTLTINLNTHKTSATRQELSSNLNSTIFYRN
jgi:type II secretory pathway pseudopilin PulG